MSRRLALAAVLLLPACGSSTDGVEHTVLEVTPTTQPPRVAEAADPTIGFDALVAAATTHTPPRRQRASRSQSRPRRYQTPRSAPAGGGSAPMPPDSVKRCESGGNYQAQNRTSSASGAWQIINSTWDNYKGYPTAASAPPEIQDERAAQLWAGGKGAGHWRACL